MISKSYRVSGCVPLDLRQLRYFVAIAEASSFHRAAERIHVSQPALSQRIRALEAEIGSALFDRSPRGVTLTAAGEAFLIGAHRTLREAELALSSARLADGGEAGSLSVAFNELGGQQPLVGRALALFASAFPAVALNVSELGSAPQRERIRAGELDAGFHYQSAAADTGLRHTVLEEHEFMAALAEHHPLAARETITPGDLDGEALIALRRAVNEETRDGIDQALTRHGVRPRVVMEASSDTAMLSLAAAGLGAAIVLGAERRGGWSGLVLRRIEGFSLAKQFVVAWHPASRSAALAKFLAVVEQGRNSP